MLARQLPFMHRLAVIGFSSLALFSLACEEAGQELCLEGEDEHYDRQEYKVESKEVSAPNQVHPEEICVDAAASASGEAFCFLNGMLNNVPDGEKFLDHGNCLDVRTMGTVSHRVPRFPDYCDSRLDDAEYVADVQWVTAQLETSGCTCCHNSKSGYSTVFDFGVGDAWVSTLSNNAVLLAAGLAGEGSFVTVAPEDNHGFAAAGNVFVSQDPERMRKFFLDEVDHRELGQEHIDEANAFYGAVPNFADIMNEAPEPCPDGVGVDATGLIHWGELEGVRFVNIMQGDGLNPSIPPLDAPTGTLWRLEADGPSEAMSTGTVHYADAGLEGYTQRFPRDASTAPDALVDANSYRIFATTRTSGVNHVSCEFTYPIEAP
jgi:hypothetical protein